MKKITERFFKYIKIDTKSDESRLTCPSTESQMGFAKLMVEELKAIGMDRVSLDDNGYVSATLSSNTDKDIPVIGFVAHMDTAPSFSGKNINPRIVEKYNGEEIILNNQDNIIMSPNDFPELKNYLGQDLIVTDGTTLLGADDKAGITEIITAMEYLINNPHIKHGEIKVGFTPDEEIGKGADLFDVEKFGADYAYTIDGGEIGELEYENFNAASAMIKINGRNIHPGTSKNKMVNSVLLGMELNSMLPVNERPEYTENYEGFFLLCDIKGDVESTNMNYIIRDHHIEKFDQKKNLIKNAVDFLNKKYGLGIFELEIKDSYYNMREKVLPVIEIVDIVKKSMEDIGINPIVKPIRGGTDGARLSYMGLPCPNIFTGGHNFHGKFEYIPVQSMEKSVELIVKICQNYVESEISIKKKK
ncbi:peptidase T [Ilyobacter polytropus]|uniref:Peptidase T n=1 Tax=Ilyobacter polytropus (strain ATCC 51220 / DSM 2926 / LMG 16218 / CuHBu1) TaxID=572544 RepID=E3H6H1_ILYPC|nr:peptidase T [Ilyobacter polytropus]ADO82384.1 peptidase T [Ilyobacter polytropus DSM 2926]